MVYVKESVAVEDVFLVAAAVGMGPKALDGSCFLVLFSGFCYGGGWEVVGSVFSGFSYGGGWLFGS